jgi:hypothetical protein
VPGAAAQLPVGDRLQADGLLLRDGLADGRVLDRAALTVGDLATLEAGARIGDGGRAQEAADVVGAEGRGRVGRADGRRS